MQFADDCRERAVALIGKDDPKAPMDQSALMWLSLAILEDQLVYWAAQIERDSKTE
jgi:hypothetical protein